MKKFIAFMNAYSQGKSGGDIWFIELAKRLKECDITVVTSLLGKELCEREGLNAEYFIASRELGFVNIIRTYIKRTIRVITSNIKGDIYYATSDFLPDVLPSYIGKVRNHNAMWVQKIYHLIPKKRIVSFLAQRLSLMLIKRNADMIFVDNSLLQDDLISLGFSRSKINVVSFGIDIEYFEKIQPSKECYAGVFLGRLKSSKGIYDLIDIWRLVCEAIPKSKLAIIGYGEEKTVKGLKQRIKDCKLDENIKLFGYLMNDEAFSIIKASKVFVFPSHEEGYGIAILEAMACGLPVVAYDLPVYKKNFADSLVTASIRDVEGFAQMVIEIYNNKMIYNKCKTLGRDVCVLFDREKLIEKEIKVINNYASKHI
jgi:glycosyltransferase involved in cell wall biosynthesis